MYYCVLVYVYFNVLLQVLFFGFGWLFFMRQLFKDYEVIRIVL